jgi:hypothetical protein
MMINQRLTEAADRSFWLSGAMLMRKAIARLQRVDRQLSKAERAPAAVAGFLQSAPRIDLHRFFARYVALQAVSRGIPAPASNALPPASGSRADRHADGSVAADRDVVLVRMAHRGAVLRTIRQMAGLHIHLLALVLLGGLAALVACAGLASDRNADIRRDPTACRLRPDSFPYPAPVAPSARRTAAKRSAATRAARRRARPEPRDGPPVAADDLQRATT